MVGVGSCGARAGGKGAYKRFAVCCGSDSREVNLVDVRRRVIGTKMTRGKHSRCNFELANEIIANVYVVCVCVCVCAYVSCVCGLDVGVWGVWCG